MKKLSSKDLVWETIDRKQTAELPGHDGFYVSHILGGNYYYLDHKDDDSRGFLICRSTLMGIIRFVNRFEKLGFTLDEYRLYNK